MKLLLVVLILYCSAVAASESIHRYDFKIPSNACHYVMVDAYGSERCARDCSEEEGKLAYAMSTCKEYGCTYTIAGANQSSCLSSESMTELMQLPFLSCFDNDYYVKKENMCIAWKGQRPSDMDAWIEQRTKRLSDDCVSMPNLRNADPVTMNKYAKLIGEQLTSGASHVAYKPFIRDTTFTKAAEQPTKTQNLFVTQKDIQPLIAFSHRLDFIVAVILAVLLSVAGWRLFDFMGENSQLIIEFDGVVVGIEFKNEDVTAHALYSLYPNHTFVIDNMVVDKSTRLIDIWNKKIEARQEV